MTSQYPPTWFVNGFGSRGGAPLSKKYFALFMEKRLGENNRIPTLLVNNSTSQVPFQMLCENIVENVE